MARSTAVLATVLVITVLAVGIGGYFGWQAYSSLSEENAQQATNVSSLRRQLAEKETTPTPAPTATPAPTPVPPVGLVEYKVSFTPSAEISDVTPTYVAASKTYAVNTKSLAEGGGECAAPGALGSVSRVAKGRPAPAGTEKVATVGAYDYYLSGPSAECAAVAAAAQTQTAQHAALKTALAGLK